jgi:prepilin-type N-terminal cleavage/methylation domain-containing protein
MEIINKLKSNSGFTLVEMLISIVVIGIVAVTIVVILANGANMVDKAMKRKALISEVNTGIEKFNREARSISQIYSYNSKYFAFSTTFDTTVVVGYTIQTNGTFTREIVGGSSAKLVARNIDYTGSNFLYFNNFDVIGTPIRWIRLSLLFTFSGDTTRYTVDVSPESYREN